MQLYFTGTGSAFNPTLGNNGAFFTHGADLYLIDCGEMLFSKLWGTRLFTDFAGAITVVLTHMHADHCGSLGTLALYAAERLKRPITLVHPNEQVRTLLSLMGVREHQYKLVSSLDERGIKIEPRPVKHVPNMQAFGYLLSDANETIYYSGDSSELLPEVLDGLREGKIARAYQDANDYPDGVPSVPVHLPLSTLSALIEPELRSKFTLMHLNLGFAAKAARMGFGCAEPDRYFVMR